MKKEKQIQTHIVAIGGHSYLPTKALVITVLFSFAYVFQPVFAAGKYTQSAGYLEEKSLCWNEFHNHNHSKVRG